MEPPEDGPVRRTRLVSGLAAAFGLMTAIFAVGGLVNPVLFVFALLFASVTYLLYSHATGRLLGRFYRGVEQRAAQGGADPGRGGFGAGPREGNRRQTRRQREQTGRRHRQGRRRQTGVGASDDPTPREACSVLGVDPGADERAVREAYRSRVKEVHPDTEGGDQDEFKRVREAYEVLTD
jgi:DnaJ-class molecular chaperone with C-terminal Zn finger domain